MPQTFNQKQHLPQVDYVRAIASLAVALFHLGGKALPVLKYGWLGVQMFFVLSGFIICWAIPQNYTWRNAGTFIGKRLVRIEPPYIASIILILSLNWLFTDAYKGPGISSILGHLAYANNFTGRPYLSPVYWTLGIEFQFYLFIALVFPFINSKWGSWALMAIGLIAYNIKIPGDNLFSVFSFFTLGMLYYLWFTKRTSLLLTIIFISAVIIQSWFAAGWQPTLAGGVTLLILALPLKDCKLVGFFAKISFSLYLTHDAVGSRLVVYLGQYLPKTLVGKGIAFTCGIVASIIFAYIFYLLIEQPCLKLSRRITYKSQPNPAM